MHTFKIKLFWLVIIQFLVINISFSQYKSFKIGTSGDTLNIIDKNNLKQGKWVTRIEELRGEPGYEEEGIYKAGKKEGIWRMYSLNNDIIGVEFYKLGGKDGIQQYYTELGDLIRQESWRAYNPDAPYDTIPVYGTGSNEIINYKIVKAETYSVRHGDWKYFDPSSGRLVKKEKYDRGHLEVPETAASPIQTVKDNKEKKVDKTPQMLEWEKKNKGKKKVIRDGATGM